MADTHYQVLVACHEKLISGIERGADSLADALYQKGVLSESLRDDIYLEQQQVRKARLLLSFLGDKIKYFPRRYNDLLSILREKSDLYPKFETLVVQLEDKKAEILGEGELINFSVTGVFDKYNFFTSAQVVSGSDCTLASKQTYVSNESEQDNNLYIRFECSCRQCCIGEFLNGKSCPKSSPKPLPQLSVWTTESSRRVITSADIKYSEYKVVMTVKNKAIQTRYRSLLSNTVNELKAKHSLLTVKDQLKALITPPGAKKSLYTRMYTRNVKGHTGDLQTYDQLQKYLENNFCSWFNISLIESLRRVLLNHQEDSKVTDYNEHIQQYLMRCCFKQTRCDEHQHQHNPEIVCAAFTDFREVNEKQIRQFESHLRQIIILWDGKRRVDEHSGDLIFRIEFKDTVEFDGTSQREEDTESDDMSPVMVRNIKTHTCAY